MPFCSLFIRNFLVNSMNWSLVYSRVERKPIWNLNIHNILSAIWTWIGGDKFNSGLFWRIGFIKSRLCGFFKVRKLSTLWAIECLIKFQINTEKRREKTSFLSFKSFKHFAFYHGNSSNNFMLFVQIFCGGLFNFNAIHSLLWPLSWC